MNFSASSYFAGVATVFIATAVGFSGGFMISKDTKTPAMTRVERVASDALPLAGAATPTTDSTGASASNVRTIEITRAPATLNPDSDSDRPAPPTDAQTVTEVVGAVARDDDKDDMNNTAPVQSAQRTTSASSPPQENKDRNAQSTKVKREAARRNAERSNARKQRELDMATEAVRRIPPESERRDVAEGPSQTISFSRGVFGAFVAD